MNQTNQQTEAGVESSLLFIKQLIEDYSPRDFRIRFWDGATIDPDSGQTAEFTLSIKHAGAVRQMFWPFNKASVGESYIYDDFDIEGDIQAFFRLLRHLIRKKINRRQRLSLFCKLLKMPKSQAPRLGRQGADLKGQVRSQERDKQAIQYHYDDPPNEFFGLFLDPNFQYTCGYFSDPDKDLDDAQQHKLDMICKKLRLKAGEKLIDFGCGWGNLITYAAKNYGVEAVGVTLSSRHVQAGKKLISDMGLQDRCRVEHMDYRDFPEDQSFDKAVSVGFCEHLGEKGMPVFFQKVWNLLPVGGQYLHHAITMKPFTPYPPWRAFALKYVFPDGDLSTIPNTLQYLSAAGFEVRDVESLREHYILTLQHWLKRLENNYEKACQLTDEVTYRIFRIYFAGSMQGFRTGLYNIYQTLVTKSPDTTADLPLTRQDWYI